MLHEKQIFKSCNFDEDTFLLFSFQTLLVY